MPQIINETNVGGRLGEGLGYGIQDALNYLTQKKLTELNEGKQFRSNEAALLAKGYAPEQARGLAGLKGPELAAAIKTSPGEPATSDSINALRISHGLEPLPTGSNFGQVMKQIGQQPRQAPQQMPSATQKQQEAAAIFPQDQQQLVNAAKQLANPLHLQQGKLERIGAVSKQTPQEIKRAAEEIHEALNKPQAVPAQPTLPRNLTSLDKYAGLSKKEIEEAIKHEAESRRHAFKETKEDRHKAIEESRSAKAAIRDLNRIEELNEEGKLDTPGYVEFLKRSGLDIPALMNPQSEEFGKIAQNFLKDAKTYYGGRVSNFEVEQFLKTVPSLSQSPEGRKRVIANLKNMAHAKIAYADTLKEIIKENKGTPPLDLIEQIDDRIDSKLDKLSEKFKKDLEKKVPAGQNKLITALQSGLGSLLGAPGKILGGASKVAPALLEAL